MKKSLILILSAVLVLGSPLAVLGDDDLSDITVASGTMVEGDESDGGDMILYADGSDEAAGAESNEMPVSEAEETVTEKDPGEYVTAPNGYAYTAPRVPDNTLKIYDFADLLTDAEETALKSEIIRAEKSRNCTVMVVTTRNTDLDPNYDVAVTRAYAEDFYEANMEGLKSDAWIMCIDMKNRVIYTVGYGRYAQEKYVDFTKEVYNDVVEYAAAGRYGEVVRTFARDVYKLDNWLNALIPTALSLIISLILSLIVMIVLLSKHKTAEPVNVGQTAVRVLNKQRVGHNAIFLGKNTTSRRIVRESSGGGGGGGGGFSGGMHTSGGGHTTSGGGGHF